MKKTVIGLAVVGIVIALGAFFSREEKSLITDFSWSIRGKTAPYWFLITNHTSSQLSVVVLLVAEDVAEGRAGAKLHLVGQAKAEITLAPHEEKKVDGVIDLLHFGSSATVVSYNAEIK